MYVRPQRTHDRGFTVVEFTVVMAIVALLLTFGVPRLRDAGERTRAAAAVQYLLDVRLAQDRYRAVRGHYAQDVADLELTAAAPEHFEVGLVRLTENQAGRDLVSNSDSQGWSLSLARHVETSSYGAYTITYNERGYDSASSTLRDLPAISPLDDDVRLLP